MWVEKHRAVWRIRDLVDGKKVTVETGFTTKTAANNRKTVLRADQINGKYIDPRAAAESLEDVARRWWAKHKKTLGPESVKSEGGRLENHVIALLGDFAIGEVDDKAIALWIAELEEPEDDDRKPLKPKTIRNCHGVLHSVLQYAVDTRLIATNWCTLSSLPKVTHREMRFLSQDEIGRLLSLIPLPWRPLFLFLVATGARFGEAIAVKKRVFDAKARRVRIERSLHELPYEGLVETTPKTRFSMRTIGLPTRLVGMMGELADSIGPDEYVFRSVKGRPIRYSTVLRVWYRAIAETEFEKLRIHDLRHTHASQLIAKNRPLTAIQRRLGHSSIQITSDLYGHLLPEVDEGMIAAVEDSLKAVDFNAWEAEVKTARKPPQGNKVGGIRGESNSEQAISVLHNTALQTRTPRSEPIPVP